MSEAGKPQLRFVLNSERLVYEGSPTARLADVIRDEYGLTGTKVGCNAGDCGACTVMIDGRQFCACLTPMGQVAGKTVVTVETLVGHGTLSRIQRAFHKHGAAQCGICSPGMMMAATDLLAAVTHPSEQQVKDALAGVLCRCTGYRKIIDAVLDAGANARVALPVEPASGKAIGARAGKVDGLAKLTGAEKFGSDDIPADALWLRVVRSRHHRARFSIGDLQPLLRQHAGLVRILSAADVPFNGFGVYPAIKDQPVLADGEVRYRGEAVLALVGSRAAVEGIADAVLPIRYDVLPPLFGVPSALAPDAPLIHASHAGNLLVEGRVVQGDAGVALKASAFTAGNRFQTAFVEHAAIEPEAGWARRDGDRLEIHVSTQSPYLDRDETASVMRLRPDQIRIVPSACGGGFGGKLDLSVQPLVALAAWLLARPVACVYSRPESMAATTKRHPASITAQFGCDRDGHLTAAHIRADFDTGAYASWGPTVANRVPVHAMGPYRVPNVDSIGRAIFTNGPPAGAFRGFGVPQAAIAHEAMMDDLAGQCGQDRLAFRRRNALRAGDRIATGQVLDDSVGLIACLDALQPHWNAALADCALHNQAAGPVRRGAGIACLWYGIGNTGLSNPSTMRIRLGADGRVTLYSGATDIGQGANTVLTQIAADALGLPMGSIGLVTGDTDRTADAGKTSASRQTFISGKAVQLAATDLRQQMLRLGNAGPNSRLSLDGVLLRVIDGDLVREIDLAALPSIDGDILTGEGRFDPPTTPLDTKGQGNPYASYAFGAQIAIADVDMELGTTRLVRIIAAHDVGRAINPQQVEGQIEGGVAQGIGFALMEEYLPGKTENLHDYLIPTIGDVPPIDCILIEDPEPLGPSGAKGVGEPALIATAPAILSAIHHATGARIRTIPALPHRLRAVLRGLPHLK